MRGKKQILLCLVIALFFACSGDTQQQEAKALRLPDQQLDSSTIVFTIDGERNAVLWAEHIYKFNDSKEMLAKNIKVDFEGKPPEGKGVLLADSGIVSDGQNVIEVFGNVKLNTQKGSKLFTESLKWDTQSDLITSEDYVKIIREGMELKGRGLETDIGFNNVVIKEQISGDLSD